MRKCWHWGRTSPPILKRTKSAGLLAGSCPVQLTFSWHLHCFFSRWCYNTSIVTTQLGNITRSKSTVLEFICAYLNRAEWRKTLFFPLASSNSCFKPTAYSKSSKITQLSTSKKFNSLEKGNLHLFKQNTYSRDCESSHLFCSLSTILYLATSILQHQFLKKKCIFKETNPSMSSKEKKTIIRWLFCMPYYWHKKW